MEKTDKKLVSLERGWLILLRDLGVEPRNVLRRARLPEDLFHREGARVSVAEYFRLWAGLEAETSDPLLPIRVGDALSPEAFDPPLFAALCSPNLRVAVRRISEYKKLMAPMHVVAEEDARGLFVGCRWDEPDLRVPPSLAVTDLVFLTRLARIATRERIEPLAVESPHSLEPRAAYQDYFGVAPVPAARHGVMFRAADADRPFLTASDALWATFRPELRRRLTKLEASASLAERVRSVLLESLPSGEASIEAVARRLGTAPRTLQRTLKAEGASYKDIVRDTREQLARHYLVDTNLTHAEIAFLLGFREPSSFFRAFRGWTGETPAAVRLAAGPRTSRAAG